MIFLTTARSKKEGYMDKDPDAASYFIDIDLSMFLPHAKYIYFLPWLPQISSDLMHQIKYKISSSISGPGADVLPECNY